jgi:L-amino acid N-acyltransferase YncA
MIAKPITDFGDRPVPVASVEARSSASGTPDDRASGRQRDMKLFGAAYPQAMVVRHYSTRPARADDADTICGIYNEGIEDRATLETEARTPEERRSWLAARDARHPVVVVESDGVVIGWASLNVFNARDAYRHVADVSVYVARASRGKGAGTALLGRLVELAREIGFHKLVLAGFPWNAASVALYRKIGFREVGVYREQGLMDGRWVDVVLMERLL